MINRKELQNKLGVSSATISRFFNHPHLLKLEIRIKIAKVIKETGYELNPFASKLAGKLKGKIGFVLPELPDLYSFQRFQSIYYLLLQELNKKSLILEVIEIPTNEKISQYYDKIIFYGDQPAKFTSKENMDFIYLFPSKITPTMDSYIYMDHFEAGKSLANLFIPASSQTPLILLPDVINKFPLNEIIKGFKKYFKQNSITANPHHFIKGANSFESGAELTQEGFALGLDFHSIIAFNQEAILGASFMIRQEGLSYPFDIQLINFGHPREFYFLEHQISHFSDPLEKIITLISKFIDGKKIKETIEPILVEGQTY